MELTAETPSPRLFAMLARVLEILLGVEKSVELMVELRFASTLVVTAAVVSVVLVVESAVVVDPVLAVESVVVVFPVLAVEPVVVFPVLVVVSVVVFPVLVVVSVVVLPVLVVLLPELEGLAVDLVISNFSE